MHDLDNMGFVETGDNTKHTISHIGDVPLLVDDGKLKHLAVTLHVPRATKNLTFVSQRFVGAIQL